MNSSRAQGPPSLDTAGGQRSVFARAWDSSTLSLEQLQGSIGSYAAVYDPAFSVVSSENSDDGKGSYPPLWRQKIVSIDGNNGGRVCVQWGKHKRKWLPLECIIFLHDSMPTVTAGDRSELVVDKVVARRIIANVTLYLVAWRGYPYFEQGVYHITFQEISDIIGDIDRCAYRTIAETNQLAIGQPYVFKVEFPFEGGVDEILVRVSHDGIELDDGDLSFERGAKIDIPSLGFRDGSISCTIIIPPTNIGRNRISDVQQDSNEQSQPQRVIAPFQFDMMYLNMMPGGQGGGVGENNFLPNNMDNAAVGGFIPALNNGDDDSLGGFGVPDGGPILDGIHFSDVDTNNMEFSASNISDPVEYARERGLRVPFVKRWTESHLAHSNHLAEKSGLSIELETEPTFGSDSNGNRKVICMVKGCETICKYEHLCTAHHRLLNSKDRKERHTRGGMTWNQCLSVNKERLLRVIADEGGGIVNDCLGQLIELDEEMESPVPPNYRIKCMVKDCQKDSSTNFVCTHHNTILDGKKGLRRVNPDRDSVATAVELGNLHSMQMQLHGVDNNGFDTQNAYRDKMTQMGVDGASFAAKLSSLVTKKSSGQTSGVTGNLPNDESFNGNSLPPLLPPPPEASSQPTLDIGLDTSTTSTSVAGMPPPVARMQPSVAHMPPSVAQPSVASMPPSEAYMPPPPSPHGLQQLNDYSQSSQETVRFYNSQPASQLTMDSSIQFQSQVHGENSQSQGLDNDHDDYAHQQSNDSQETVQFDTTQPYSQITMDPFIQSQVHDNDSQSQDMAGDDIDILGV